MVPSTYRTAFHDWKPTTPTVLLQLALIYEVDRSYLTLLSPPLSRPPLFSSHADSALLSWIFGPWHRCLVTLYWQLVGSGSYAEPSSR